MIPLYSPQISQEDIKSVTDSLQSLNISTRGTTTTLLEEAFAAYLHTKPENVLATNSGTAALFLAIKSLPIPPKSNILVPNHTYIATANAVLMAGHNLVIGEVNEHLGVLDPHELIDKFQVDIAATIPVRIYGNHVRSIFGSKYGHLVEDSAQDINPIGSLGSTYSYPMAFSLNGNKTITAGGGGFLVADRDTVEWARKFASQARPDSVPHSQPLGFNMRMPSLNAALALSQLKRIKEFHSKKVDIFTRYAIAFQDHLWYATPWIFPLKVEDGRAEEVVRRLLHEYGIETRQGFKPLTEVFPQAPYIPNARNREAARNLFNSVVLLPSSPDLSSESVDYIIKSVKEVLSDRK